jgi:uncharacterized protein (DUF433 family)
MSIATRINQNPAVSEGRPCLRETGITVAAVLKLVAAGESASRIVAGHPGLETDDVQAALEFFIGIVNAPDGATPGALRKLGMSGADLAAFLTSPHVDIGAIFARPAQVRA